MSVTIKEPYVVGEKPAPLDYQFQDSGGTAITITGFTAEFHIQERFGPVIILLAAVSDGPNGTVRHTFTGTEFSTSGEYWGQFIVGNGTSRYVSTLIKFKVAAAIGTMPSI